MSMQKKFDKNNPICRVTFILNKELSKSVKQVNLTGDFNNWDRQNIRMKKNKIGFFSVSVNLNTGKEYQFKYLIDQSIWLNEPEADKQVSNEFKSSNSVITI
nr:isoamylase early set domain-containing protein [uncultured Carboxylicivirga sp.]